MSNNTELLDDKICNSIVTTRDSTFCITLPSFDKKVKQGTGSVIWRTGCLIYVSNSYNTDRKIPKLWNLKVQTK